MKLTVEDLRAITEGLEKLYNIGPMRVRSFEVNGLTVYVHGEDSQMDGMTYYVVGIEKTIGAGSGGKPIVNVYPHSGSGLSYPPGVR